MKSCEVIYKYILHPTYNTVNTYFVFILKHYVELSVASKCKPLIIYSLSSHSLLT
jgi:hypothetical protein